MDSVGPKGVDGLVEDVFDAQQVTDLIRAAAVGVEPEADFVFEQLADARAVEMDGDGCDIVPSALRGIGIVEVVGEAVFFTGVVGGGVDLPAMGTAAEDLGTSPRLPALGESVGKTKHLKACFGIFGHG